jgi:hypothetical protein
MTPLLDRDLIVVASLGETSLSNFYILSRENAGRKLMRRSHAWVSREPRFAMKDSAR